MSVIEVKNVKWSADERVDLQDLQAMSDLKDVELKELYRIFFEPGTRGVVLRGFNFVNAGGPPTFSLTAGGATESVAIAPDGSLLKADPAVTVTQSLATGQTSYVHIYQLDADSDVDNRRYINDIPVPPEEVTVNAATRTTKKVGIYVTTPGTPGTIDSSYFSTTAFIGGKTRSLISMAIVDIDSGGAVNQEYDARIFFLDGIGDYAFSTIPNAFPFSANYTNVKGVKSQIKAIQSVFWSLFGRTDQSWSNPGLLLADPLNGVSTTTFRARLSANKSVFATVAAAGGINGDYATLASALSSINTGEIRLKAGVHTVAVNTTLTNKAGLTISGEGRDVSVLRMNVNTPSDNNGIIFGANNAQVHFRDMTIQSQSADGITGVSRALLYWSTTSTVRVTFTNCKFQSDSTSILNAVAGGASKVQFVNCEFNMTSNGIFNTYATGWNPPNTTNFTGCYFTPNSSSSAALVTFSTGNQNAGVTKCSFTDCEFGDVALTTRWGGLTAGLQYQSGSNLTWEMAFNGCRFFGLEHWVRVGTVATANWYMKMAFNNCTMALNGSGVPTLGLIYANSGSQITFDARTEFNFDNCDINHKYVIQMVNGKPPSIFATNTTFVIFENVADSIGIGGFVCTGIYPLNVEWRFIGCRFLFGRTSAFLVQYDSSGAIGGANMAMYVHFIGCEFFTATNRAGLVQDVTTQACYFQCFGSGGTGFNFDVMLEYRTCHFYNGKSLGSGGWIPVYASVDTSITAGQQGGLSVLADLVVSRPTNVGPAVSAVGSGGAVTVDGNASYKALRDLTVSMTAGQNQRTAV